MLSRDEFIRIVLREDSAGSGFLLPKGDVPCIFFRACFCIDMTAMLERNAQDILIGCRNDDDDDEK